MPALSLFALSAMIAVPGLAGSRLLAAGPEHRSSVVVRPGESLWTIAERYTPDGASPADTVDRIVAANHLRTATLHPGQRLTIAR